MLPLHTETKTQEEPFFGLYLFRIRPGPHVCRYFYKHRFFYLAGLSSTCKQICRSLKRRFRKTPPTMKTFRKLYAFFNPFVWSHLLSATSAYVTICLRNSGQMADTLMSLTCVLINIHPLNTSLSLHTRLPLWLHHCSCCWSFRVICHFYILLIGHLEVASPPLGLACIWHHQTACICSCMWTRFFYLFIFFKYDYCLQGFFLKQRLKKKYPRMCGQALILALMLWLSSKDIVQKSARATAQVWVPAVQHERGYLVSVRVRDDQHRKDKCRQCWIKPSWKTVIIWVCLSIPTGGTRTEETMWNKPPQI